MITEEQLNALHKAGDALSAEDWDEVFRLARIGARVITIVGEYDLDLLGLAEDITIYDEELRECTACECTAFEAPQ